MVYSVDKLKPNELGLPDPTHPGNLVFGAYCDTPKLINILKSGIKPRNGKPEISSYYPNVVSLSATGSRGYANTSGIQMGWYNIIQNAKRFGHIDVDNAFCYSFILDQTWIENNILKFNGVGAAFHDKETSRIFKVGPLINLPVNGNIDNFKEAFYEEVHFNDGIIPPEALRGILIDEDLGNSIAAVMNIGKAVEEIRKVDNNIKFPIGIYNKEGQLVELVG